MKCPICGLENADSEKYCFNCNQNLDQKVENQYLNQYYSQYSPQFQTKSPSQTTSQSNQSLPTKPSIFKPGGPVQADGTPQPSSPDYLIIQKKEKKKPRIVITVIAVVVILIIAAIGVSLYYLTDLDEGDKLEKVMDNDSDGVPDNEDAFPHDSKESKDSDGDGIGDNSDAFPLDPNENKDSDGDGKGDNTDLDDDNDGFVDTLDAFPNDSSEWEDWDEDNVGDNSDPFLIKSLTNASTDSEDSYQIPRYFMGDIYFLKYRWSGDDNDPSLTGQDIVKYNISTGTTTTVYEYTLINEEQIHEIAVAYNIIYFTKDNTISNNNIKYQDYSTKLCKFENNQEKTIRNSGMNEHYSDLSIFNNRLVFVFNDNENSSVYLKDRGYTLIEGGNSYSPDVDETSIVYIHKTGGHSFIRLHNNAKITNLTDPAPGVSYYRPMIHDGSVVYERKADEVNNIVYYDEEIGIHTQLTNTPEHEKLFDFDGNHALYYRNSNNEDVLGLYVFNVHSGKETKLTNFSIFSAELFGNYVTCGSLFNVHQIKIK